MAFSPVFLLFQFLDLGLEVHQNVLDISISNVVFEITLLFLGEEIDQFVNFLLVSLLSLLSCFGPRRFLFLFEVRFRFFDWRLFLLPLEGIRIDYSIFLFISHFVPFLFDLFKPLCLFLLFFFLRVLVILDILLELIEPFFMTTEYREHSLPGFVFVVSLNWRQTYLITGKDPPAKFSASR